MSAPWIPPSGVGRAELDRLVREAIDRSEISTRVRRLEAEVGGQVNSTGSIAVGRGFTVNKTGVGAYTVTYVVPFVAPPAKAGVTAIGAGAISARFGTVGAASLTVVTFTSNTGAVVDASFVFFARP